MKRKSKLDKKLTKSINKLIKQPGKKRKKYIDKSKEKPELEYNSQDQREAVDRMFNIYKAELNYLKDIFKEVKETNRILRKTHGIIKKPKCKCNIKHT